MNYVTYYVGDVLVFDPETPRPMNARPGAQARVLHHSSNYDSMVEVVWIDRLSNGQVNGKYYKYNFRKVCSTLEESNGWQSLSIPSNGAWIEDCSGVDRRGPSTYSIPADTLPWNEKEEEEEPASKEVIKGSLKNILDCIKEAPELIDILEMMAINYVKNKKK
jgi:hypothetical protein